MKSVEHLKLLNRNYELFGVVADDIGLLRWFMIYPGSQGPALVNTINQAKELQSSVEQVCGACNCRVVKVVLVEDDEDHRTNALPTVYLEF